MKKPRCDPRLSKIHTNDLLKELAARNHVFISAGWYGEYVFRYGETNYELRRWFWGRGAIWEKLKLARWLCVKFAFGRIDFEKFHGAQRRARRGMAKHTGGSRIR